MSTPIAIQLYTVREALARDFEGTVRRIAEIGYAGVEPFPSPSIRPREASELFRSLGLAVPSVHVAMPDGPQGEEVLETADVLGCSRIVSGLGAEHYRSLEQVKRSCERFNKASKIASAHGLSFGIHNHWWEFEPVEGRYPYQVMMEYLDPSVFWEIDTYWVKTAGLDPARVLRELGERVPLLHIKDGPAVKGEPMVAVGQGSLDVPRIIEAGDGQAEWLIVELDSSATDMMEAVEESYRYLVEEGLGRGTTG
ncbi:MAG: sugar phosphate isomerase/epimerase [Chloroflexota bacterium]|nr:sugar phosphate isomerase/epimerase [Chloroflexota bacterium]